MSAATEPRTAAIIGAEIERKRARRDALQFRQGEITTELESLRTAHARALADGSDNTSRASLTAFVQEQEGITRALDMLATDIAALEGEHAQSQHEGAKEAERLAINEATQALAALETSVRAAIVEHIMPKLGAFEAALRSARDAEQHADHARRAAGVEASMFTNSRSDVVTQHSGALMHLVQMMRKQVER